MSKPKNLKMKSIIKEVVDQMETNRLVKLKMEENTISARSKCPHQLDGKFLITMTNRKAPNGAPIYRCTKCFKEIDISPIDMEELKSAIALIDRASDIKKMLFNTEDPKDYKRYKRAAKFQNKLATFYEEYEAIKVRGNRNKKKNKNNSNGNGDRMGRSVAY
jgi:hypothetical protein